jgi:hypothetical protein
MKGDIEYFADTVLLEKMFSIVAIADENSPTLTKTAFDLSSMLSPIKSAIVSGVGSQVHSDSPVSSVVNFLAPGILFKLHPAFGIIMTAAQLFGFDLVSIFTKVADLVKKALLSGKQLTTVDINNIAQQAAPELSSTAGEDLFIGIRHLEQNGGLFKAAINPFSFFGAKDKSRYSSPRYYPSSYSGTSDEQVSPFIRMFSFLGKEWKGKFLLGFVTWVIKTVLLSAGLLVAGAAIKSMLTPSQSKTPANPNAPISQTPTNPNTPANPTAAVIKEPRPSGSGAVPMRNNPTDNWVVKLEGRKPSDIILAWLLQSYPDLNEYKDIVNNSPAFWSAVKRVTKNWPVGQSSLVIPPEFNKIDDILNLFVHDIYLEINKQESI